LSVGSVWVCVLSVQDCEQKRGTNHQLCRGCIVWVERVERVGDRHEGSEFGNVG
jgi:hypothetical protein